MRPGQEVAASIITLTYMDMGIIEKTLAAAIAGGIAGVEAGDPGQGRRSPHHLMVLRYLP